MPYTLSGLALLSQVPKNNLAKVFALVFVLLSVPLAAVLWGLSTTGQSRNLVVFDAIALPVNGAMPGLMITLNIENRGEPVTFSALSSTDAGNTHIMGGELGDVVVPGGGRISFALDGAHIMAMAVTGEMTVGRLIPLHFTLGDGSILKTQVTVAEADPMDHSSHGGMAGQPIDPAPQIALEVDRDNNSGTWQVSSTVSHFQFDTELVDTEHVAGSGHGHLYLNNVKLARYFGSDMSIGQLPAGQHRLRLDLNTNVHQPYWVNGEAVSAEVLITVD